MRPRNRKPANSKSAHVKAQSNKSGKFKAKHRGKHGIKYKGGRGDKSDTKASHMSGTQENVKKDLKATIHTKDHGRNRTGESKGKGKARNLKHDEELKEASLQKRKGKKDALIGRMMAIYENLRRSDSSKPEKRKLIEEVLTLTVGKQTQVAFKHDSVRVLEMCVKYGTKEQRTKMWGVFLDVFEDAMKSKYGRFLIQKMLKYGTKEQRTSFIKRIKGKVVQLLKHKDAGKILEEIYIKYADPKEKLSMVEDFYGTEFKILRASFGSELVEVFKAAPDRKRYVISFLKDTLEKLAGKEAVTYNLFHRPAMEYLNHSEKNAQEEFLEIMKDKVVNILHTEDGSKISMRCIWSSNAKDRKKITKSFKTHVPKICKEPFGHTVLMALFDVVDDTMLIEKFIFSEIASNLGELVQDQYGRRVILYALSPRNPKYFSPPLVSTLEQGDQNLSSKKSKEVRIREIRQSILPPLARTLKSRISEALKDNHLCHILVEVMKYLPDGEDYDVLIHKVASAVAEQFGPLDDSQDHVVLHPVGHWTLKQLVLQDKERAEKGYAKLLSKIIVDEISKDTLRSWIQSNRAAFFITRLVETDVAPVVQYVIANLEEYLLSSNSPSNKGTEALKKALETVKR